MPDYRHQVDTPDQLTAIVPWAGIKEPPGGDSMLVGYGENGPAKLDPYLLKLYGSIRAGLILVVGEIGFGKSWFIKYYLLLLFALKRANDLPFRIGADDLKPYNSGQAAGDIASGAGEHFRGSVAGGEYGPFARWANCEVIDLVHARMNILDPGLGMNIEQQHAMLSTIVMQLRGVDGNLPDYWETILQRGLEILHMLPPEQQTFKQLIRIINEDPVNEDGKPNYLWPLINGQKQRISPAEDYISATSKLSDVLKRLEGGPYGNMFNGNNSMAKAMRQRVVVVDYSPLDDTAIAMMQSIIWHMRAAALANGNSSLEINISVFDEAHRLWGIPAFAKSMAHYIKTIRALGHLILMSTQRISDFRATDSPLAVNSLGDFSMVVTFRLKHAEALNLQEMLGFTDEVRKRIENFQQGECFVLIEGQEPYYIMIPRTDLTAELAETDQASRSNVSLPQPEEGVSL